MFLFEQDYVYLTFMSQTGCSISVKCQFSSEDQKNGGIFTDQEQEYLEKEEAKK